ncbi:hypothetical protein Tco_1424206, partial [Tanacetum coccineum]
GLPEFYNELEDEILGEGEKLIGLQFIQLELRLGKTPSRSFRPVKSAEILWQFWASGSFGVSLAHNGSWSNMTPKIQKNLEDRLAFKILQELKTMFQQQAEQELFETVKAFHACKQEEGQSVSTYVLKMKAYLDQMELLRLYDMTSSTWGEHDSYFTLEGL